MTTKEEAFAKPADLSQHGENAYRVIEAWRKRKGLNYTGGCKTYYSPREWTVRREPYGCDSELVVVHDGGDLSDYGHNPLSDQADLCRLLAEVGLYLECCTGWHHAVYKI